MKEYKLNYLGTIYTQTEMGCIKTKVFDSNKNLIGTINIDPSLLDEILNKIKSFYDFQYFIKFFFTKEKDYMFWHCGGNARDKIIEYYTKIICTEKSQKRNMVDLLNENYINQVGQYCFVINNDETVAILHQEFGNFRIIELDYMFGHFYVEYLKNEQKYVLYDEFKQIINEFECDATLTFETIKNMKNIDDLQTYGWVDNICWGSTFEELYKQYLSFCGLTEEELKYDDFLGETHILQVGGIYFITNFE